MSGNSEEAERGARKSERRPRLPGMTFEDSLQFQSKVGKLRFAAGGNLLREFRRHVLGAEVGIKSLSAPQRPSEH